MASDNLTDGVVNITPHAGQYKVLTSNKRIIIGLAGLQSGKTFIGCVWTQLHIQKIPDGNHLVCALSHDQLNNVVIDKFFSLFPPYKKYYNKGEKTVYLPNSNGKVFFRSLDEPKYVEGITAHSAWIDEADLCGYKAYTVVRARTSATNGQLLLTSSLADNSWLAEHIQKVSPKYYDIITWASKDNPSFSKDEWEALQEEMDPTLFRRRYEASVDFASGLVYGKFKNDVNMIDKIPEKEEIGKSFLGIDWGYVDPTAIVRVDITKSGRIYVTRDFMVEGAPMDLIVRVINKFMQERIQEGGRINGIYADPSNKAFLKEVVSRIHHDIIPGERDIFNGTGIIRNLLHQNRFFVLKSCPHVLSELKQYRFKENVSGRSEEPEDQHNHSLDAIRYVVATYPINSVRYKPVDPTENLSPFWLRRTPMYKREMLNTQNKELILP